MSSGVAFTNACPVGYLPLHGYQVDIHLSAVLWSRSRKELKLLAAAGAVVKFRLRLLVSAQGQTQESYTLIFIYLESIM